MWTVIGGIWGMILGSLLFIPTFGVVFGVSFFVGNTILFGLGYENAPLAIETLALGIIAASVLIVILTLIGGYLGTQFGANSRNFVVKKYATQILIASLVILISIATVSMGLVYKNNKQRDLLDEKELRTVEQQSAAQKIKEITVTQTADDAELIITSDGTDAGTYVLAVTIMGYTSEIFYTFEKEYMLTSGKNIFPVRISLNEVIAAYHQRVMKNTHERYGVEEDLPVIVKLLPRKGAVTYPQETQTTIHLSFVKN